MGCAPNSVPGQWGKPGRVTYLPLIVLATHGEIVLDYLVLSVHAGMGL